MNADINVNEILQLIQKLPYGILFTYFIVFSAVIIAGIFFIGKSGFISGLRSHSEYNRKKIDREIKQKEKLLNDIKLQEFKAAMEYHIKVMKLEEFLKIKNKDIDLLEYILACKDSERAVRLYKKGKDFLEKDNASKKYKLKARFNENTIKRREILGISQYVIFNVLGTSTFLIEAINVLFRLNLPIKFNLLSQVEIFLMFFSMSLFFTYQMLLPIAAKAFLELEKISSTE